jgi:hypothetical protein
VRRLRVSESELLEGHRQMAEDAEGEAEAAEWVDDLLGDAVKAGS